MSGIGFSELLLLALIALLVVGPKRLPEIARTAGQLSRTARNAWQSLKSEFQAELDQEHNRRILATESETASDPDASDPDAADSKESESENLSVPGESSTQPLQRPDDDRSERS